jgi:ribose 5-phosphate isomerase B
LKIAIGADHAGFSVKEVLIRYLEQKGYHIIDCGCYSEESVDYPDIVVATAQKVQDKEADYGILLCGTGIGVSIAANKLCGIRCALLYNEETARLARQHNDANMIALGARTNTVEDIQRMVDAFFQAEFMQGRHAQRVEKIMALEQRERR